MAHALAAVPNAIVQQMANAPFNPPRYDGQLICTATARNVCHLTSFCGDHVGNPTDLQYQLSFPAEPADHVECSQILCTCNTFATCVLTMHC